MSGLSHMGEEGRARMVDVSAKDSTPRTATARGQLSCQAETLHQLRDGAMPKGGVIPTAELAGVMAAKRTAELIPLCHPLPLTHIEVRIEIDESLPGFQIASEVRTKAETGVEMEALTAVAVAGLTVVDMVKAVDKRAVITDVRVLAKSGGKSGDFVR